MQRTSCLVAERRGAWRTTAGVIVHVLHANPVVRRGLVAIAAEDELVGGATGVASVAQLDEALGGLGSSEVIVLVDVRSAHHVPEDLVAALQPARIVAVADEDAATDAVLLRWFEAGVRGFLLLASAADGLHCALRAVADDGLYVDPQLAGALVAMAGKGRRGHVAPFRLTVQQERVARLLCRGCSNREIAEQLGISIETAKVHVRAILRKVGAYDRVHAAEILLREGVGEG